MRPAGQLANQPINFRTSLRVGCSYEHPRHDAIRAKLSPLPEVDVDPELPLQRSWSLGRQVDLQPPRVSMFGAGDTYVAVRLHPTAVTVTPPRGRFSRELVEAQAARLRYLGQAHEHIGHRQDVPQVALSRWVRSPGCAVRAQKPLPRRVEVVDEAVRA